MTKIPAQPSWRAIKPQFKQHLGPEINEIRGSVRRSFGTTFVRYNVRYLDLDRGNFLSRKSTNLVPFESSWLTEHKSVIQFEIFLLIMKMLMDFEISVIFTGTLLLVKQPVRMRVTSYHDISTSLLMRKSSKTWWPSWKFARFETLNAHHFFTSGPICL